MAKLRSVATGALTGIDGGVRQNRRRLAPLRDWGFPRKDGTQNRPPRTDQISSRDSAGDQMACSEGHVVRVASVARQIPGIARRRYEA